MKKRISVLMVMVLLLLTACGIQGKAGEVSEDGVTHFKLGYVNGADSPIGAVAEKMNELLSERLPPYTLDIYPGGQLGGERDMIESTQLGVQDLCITATTPLTNFVHSLTPGELLYLIKDYEHADAVYQGDIGKQWLEDCRKANLIGLGFTEVGFRQLCTNEPIESLNDIEGIKLRVMECKMHVNGWKSLNCDAITMGWADAYAGVQQGTIDAVEVPYCLAYSNSVYEICKYFAETNHVYTAQAMIMSEAAWGQLSEEEQEIWKDCAQEACAYGREYSREKEQEYIETVQAEGVTITKPDLSNVKESVEKYYEKYSKDYGDIIKAIQKLAQ